MPLADSNEVFSLAYGGRIGVGYQLSPVWEAGAALSYGLGTLRSTVTPLTSTISETALTATGEFKDVPVDAVSGDVYVQRHAHRSTASTAANRARPKALSAAMPQPISAYRMTAHWFITNEPSP